MQPLSVSQFVTLINNLVQIENIAVEGEVSGYSLSQGKFIFFSLKDESAVIECFAMAFAIHVPIADGMRVRVYGTPGLYAKSGRFRVTVSSVELVGDGALKKAFEMLKKKLSDEGLFALERKRMIPTMPTYIGFIGSKSSAAYSDFVKIVNNRFPLVKIGVYDVRVQGDSAALAIVNAFSRCNDAVRAGMSMPEVLVLSRGGGSQEDLQVFNDERVVRAVYGSLIPVVSAVGHERDETLVDFVADIRASTPSNAAERIVPDRRALIESMDSWLEFCTIKLDTRLARTQSTIIQHLHYMELRVHEKLRGVDRTIQIVLHAPQTIQSVVTSRRAILEEKERILNIANPLSLLKRGYSIVYTEDKNIVKHTKIAREQEKLFIQMSDGTIVWQK